MRFSIDRFENNKAILISETGEKRVIDKSVLPDRIEEGDVLVFNGGEYAVLHSETDVKRRELNARMKALFKK